MKLPGKIVTHLAAVALGAVFAGSVLPHFSRSGESAASAARAAGPERSSAPRQAVPLARRPGKTAAYRAAWEALGSRPLDRQARLMAQRKLLADWAKIDLDRAVHAFMGETWDSSQELQHAFSLAFSERPTEAWAVLSRDPMALALLGDVWVDQAAHRDPELLVGVLGELLPQQQGLALNRLFSHDPFQEKVMTAGEREALLAKLAAGRIPAQVENWLAQAYLASPATEDPGALAAVWKSLPVGGDRTRQMAAWASTLRTADSEKFAAQWGNVPPEDRAQASRLLLSMAGNGSPALLQTIEAAVAAGQWGALGAHGVGDKLRGFQTDRQALAEWALTLPPRPELRSIFNLAISEKLLGDPAGGRAWLEQLPAGSWHRETGFNELALGSMWARGDRAAADRAIEAITDRRTREQAIKDRYDWQLITAQEEILRVD